MSDKQWNPSDVPTYSSVEAGRLVGLRPDRVRRWLLGYSYTYPRTGEVAMRRVSKSPVLQRERAEDSYASFLDLIDLLFVKEFLEHGVSLQKLRVALQETTELLGGHHFAQRSFFTDGREIFLRIGESRHALLQLMSGGQWVIAPVITAIAKQLEFQRLTGLAERWYPLGSGKSVVLDPRIRFGAPTILGRGTETAVVYDLYLAEAKNSANVCSWMKLRREELASVIAFEENLRAA